MRKTRFLLSTDRWGNVIIITAMCIAAVVGVVLSTGGCDDAPNSYDYYCNGPSMVVVEGMGCGLEVHWTPAADWSPREKYGCPMLLDFYDEVPAPACPSPYYDSAGCAGTVSLTCPDGFVDSAAVTWINCVTSPRQVTLCGVPSV